MSTRKYMKASEQATQPDVFHYTWALQELSESTWSLLYRILCANPEVYEKQVKSNPTGRYIFAVYLSPKSFSTPRCSRVTSASGHRWPDTSSSPVCACSTSLPAPFRVLMYPRGIPTWWWTNQCHVAIKANFSAKKCEPRRLIFSTTTNNLLYSRRFLILVTFPFVVRVLVDVCTAVIGCTHVWIVCACMMECYILMYELYVRTRFVYACIVGKYLRGGGPTVVPVYM